jgi:CubicO group peptidase (beta-lactamase class C family)
MRPGCPPGVAVILIFSFALAFGCSSPPDLESGSADKPWPGATWPTSTPAEQGIDSTAIDSLVADIDSGDYGLVDAFMLVRNGYVVADHRFTHDYKAISSQYDATNHMYNYDHPDWHPYLKGTKLHTLQSVTKSVTSAALGIAIDKGILEGVHIPVMPFFKAYEPYVTDSRKESTTLEDLLTMRSGLQWNTSGGYSSSTHSTVQLEASDDWIRFILEQPTDGNPGERYQYNDGASVLLGKILREATGKRADEWAKEHLFNPIGITDFYWKITPDGEADTEGGLYLATEDLARIGYLFLRGGEWKGRQIVSREWVEASTAPVVADVAPDNDRSDPGYGYQWWVTDKKDGKTKIFAGNGYGGQFVMVSPEHDIVVVFNGWNIHGGGKLSTYQALKERIIPAIIPNR